MVKKSLMRKAGNVAVVTSAAAYVGKQTIHAVEKSTPVRNGLVKVVDEKAANVIDEFILGEEESQKKKSRRLPDVDAQQDFSSEHQIGC